MPAPYRWVVLAVAVVGFMQTHLHRMAFPPLIPTFVADLGLSYAAVGTIQSAYFWTYTAVQMPVGIIADRWGTRRVMLTCMALLALGVVAFASSRSFATGVAARMLIGLGASAVWVPAMRLVSEWFPAEERARAAGVISAGGGLGGTLGFLLVPWLAALWGWRWAYAATAVPALASFALIALCLRSGSAGGATARMTEGLASVLRARPLWPFNLLVFFAYGAYFSLLTFLPAFLVKVLGASPPQAGAITGLITAGTVVSWPLAGWLSDRLGRRKPIVLASQVASVGMCLYFALAALRLPLAGAAIAALASGLILGGLILPFVMIVELSPPHLAATAAGATNTSCLAGAMVLPIVLGRLVDVTGAFTAAFLLAAALEALALVFGLVARETGRRA